ncbi:asparaginyl-tRNA synthetase-like protein [Mollisia scopiformis]|uniref:asparagine--tRNA ligase n=1 Tax=Mollisia scopiformis TaxID=149040 RepID=A0A194X4J3_MOLSC|nr:asparaginyl-tRNA synthetase-like protein [Mollisia scopiformis]KUJ15100.1 asparaginyl-tRNA synthetase-like protein [Mollisia scopiformis]
MVQPRPRPHLLRCVGQAFKGCRATHSSSDSYRLSIARLLDDKPAYAKDVVVTGFVRSIRNQKQRSFASIGDGSSLESLQALLTPAQAQSLSTGTAVRFTGSWRPSPNPKAQSHELHVADVDIIGPAEASTFPLQKKYHTPEYLRTMPHLRTRVPLNSTLLRFRSDAIAAVTNMFYKDGFTQSHTPIITSSDCEGAGEVFHLDSSQKGPKTKDDDGTFFRAPKYLTVSSQLHLEALAQSVGNVWTLSPTFRAEKSDTARHLSEFYMLEAEISFTEDMNDVMRVVQNTIGAITKDLESGSRVGKELLSVSPDLDLLPRRWRGGSRDFPKVTYTEAINILRSSSHQFEYEPRWGAGLQAEHERYIANELGTSWDASVPVFVTHYPKVIKPFYMLSTAANENSRETVDCFDLLVPEACEIVGGSMREHRLEPLIKSMQACKMIPPGPIPSDDELGELKWYIDLRRWGSVPHGGFGLGFDRLLAYLAGVPNIREMVTFPRWVGRCEC